MERYQIYNIMHIFGALMLFMAYGALLVRVTLAPENVGVRKLGAILSGVGLVLLLVGGFAMLGLGRFGWTYEFLIKIAIWVILGGLMVLINKKPELNKALWIVTLVLGLVAVSLGVLHPFI